MKTKISLIMLSAVILLGMPVKAEVDQPAEGADYLTKSEVINMISASDFVKKKIGDLLSWSVGYDISRVNRARLTPSINYVRILPRRSPPDGRTILDVTASVDDPGGLNNVSGVRADLSSIGRMTNTILVDNGLFGDKTANDGIYTLQTSVSPKTDNGAKDIEIAVANKKGWLALARTSLDVQRDPVLLQAEFIPNRVRAEESPTVTLIVMLDNPGRIEDVQRVTADLKQLSLPEIISLRNDGTGGDETADDNIWSVSLVLASNIAPGTYSIPVEVFNRVGGSASGKAVLSVNR